MTSATPSASSSLESRVISSITEFFVDTVGALPCDSNLQPPPGFVHIHFSNTALSRPLSFSLPENRVADVMRAQQTLMILEPLPPTIRLEFHRAKGPEAREQLEFLRSPLPRRPAEELLAARPPHRPIDALRKKLALFAEATDRGIEVGVGVPQTIKTAVEKLLYDAVARYYAVVDRGERSDIAEIVAMFDKHGVYDRAGKMLTGRREIARFYTGERTLIGTHQVHSIVASNLLVHVTGVFEGKSAGKNEPRRLEFADTWRWNLHGAVAFRHTYLSQGHQLTT